MNATSLRASSSSTARWSETLNTMLQGVVTDGTGKATQLDYTY